MKATEYYVPSLEEFHLGFEYEEDDNNTDNWESEVVDKGLDLEFIDDLIHEGNIRVKYLDLEDIQSFGFKYDVNNSDFQEDWFINESKFESLGIQYLLFYNYEDNLLRIERIVDCGTGNEDYLFYGYIKNKSELKRLLKQLKIV